MGKDRFIEAMTNWRNDFLKGVDLPAVGISQGQLGSIKVPTIVVPAGFTAQNLPAGLCFLGRPYDDGNLIRYAYAYEQATKHRRPPTTLV